MSGCHPTNTDPCLCNCHKFGSVKYYLTADPAIPCCKCPPLNNPFDEIREEEDVSPMVEQIQKLEEEIKSLHDHIYMLDLKIEANKFGAQMKEGSRFMECLAGVENKLQSQIDEAKSQFMSIYGKRPHKCPVCEGKGKINFNLPAGGYWEDKCVSCEGKGIVWA